jgi:hypothetical protein
MERIRPRFQILQAFGVLLLLAASGPAEAGRRMPGTYAGTVIFDRWDGCILYSGTYLMYVSEDVKDLLRPYTDQAIQVDAEEVLQRMNPGDGRIDKLRVLGPAPEPKGYQSVAGIRLRTALKEGDDGKPVATITIENSWEQPVTIHSDFLALTVLMKRDADLVQFTPSDGPSFALITRQEFGRDFDEESSWEGYGVIGEWTYSWTIGKENALPATFVLPPSGTKTLAVHLNLPDGDYDLLAGYGGGVHATRGVASNLSAFDVDDGRTIVETALNRQR